MSDQRRGAETFAVDLAAELERLGLAAPTVALHAADGPAADRLPVRVLGRSALGPSTLVALRRTARAESAAVVVAHGSRTLPACAAALAGTGVPFVYRNIGDPRVWSARGLRRWRTRVLLGRARMVAALWPGAAEVLTALHGVPADRIRVIPNGVPAERFPVVDGDTRGRARAGFDLPDDEPVIGCIASLTAEKDVGAAIAAVARLRSPAHLLVAGAGPERPRLEARAAADAPGRVRFVGRVAGSADVLAAVDAVVLPSRTEGMPGVLIEAGMSGLPVVATDVGAVAEVVADGETGVLVAPGDVEALAAGLERALADDGSMGMTARARCLERFEIGVVGARWAALLDEAASH
ncbi:MAG: glycosyltransferase family 4 protein [Acidimicrobiales bacterium]